MTCFFCSIVRKKRVVALNFSARNCLRWTIRIEVLLYIFFICLVYDIFGFYLRLDFELKNGDQNLIRFSKIPENSSFCQHGNSRTKFCELHEVWWGPSCGKSLIFASTTIDKIFSSNQSNRLIMQKEEFISYFFYLVDLKALVNKISNVGGVSSNSNVPTAKVAIIYDGATLLLPYYQIHMPHFAESAFLSSSYIVSEQVKESREDVIDHFILTSLERCGGCSASWAKSFLDYIHPSWEQRLVPAGDGFTTNGFTKYPFSNVSKQEEWLPKHEEYKSISRKVQVVDLQERSIEIPSEKCLLSSDFLVRFNKIVFPAAGRWFLSTDHAQIVRNAITNKMMSRNKHILQSIHIEDRLKVCIILRNHSRTIINLDDIISFIQRRFSPSPTNISIFHFDGKSFEEQFSSIFLCSLTITSMGAHLTNSVWIRPPGAIFIMFPWTPFRLHMEKHYFEQLMLSLGLRYKLAYLDAEDSVVYKMPCWDKFSGYLGNNKACAATMSCQMCAKQLSVRFSEKKFGEVILDLWNTIVLDIMEQRNQDSVR